MRLSHSLLLTPSGPGLAFFWRLALLLGAGLLSSAAVCWVAANWLHVTVMQKLVGLQVVLVASILLACWRLWREPRAADSTGLAANVVGLGAVLVGALFALIGQVYQTGADAWQLFALWAVLLMPWSLGLPTVFMLCLWVTVVNTALALFLLQAAALDWVSVAACLTLLNLVLLVAREVAGTHLPLGDRWRVVARAILMAAVGWWLAGWVGALTDDVAHGGLLGWPGLVLGIALATVYTRFRPDAVMLGVLGLAASVAVCLLILDYTGMQMGLPLGVVVLVLAFIFGARHLMRVVQAGRQASGHGDTEPWFLGAFRLALLGLAALMCLLFAFLVLEMEAMIAIVLGGALAIAGVCAIRAGSGRPILRDLGTVLAAAGYAMYVFQTLAISPALSLGPVALVIVPAVLIYLLAPVFVLRLFSALIALGVLVLFLWEDAIVWGGASALAAHRAAYERLLVLGLAALGAWHWVAVDDRRTGLVPLAWALVLMTLLCGWWAPALQWGASLKGFGWHLALGLVLAMLPLYALGQITRGAGTGARLGAALVLVVASVGWLGAPGVSVALTWLLMGQALKRPALTGLSIVALLTYLAQYYYQLETPLLQKAWVLGATGIWLLAGAWVFARHLSGQTATRVPQPGTQPSAMAPTPRWRVPVLLAGLAVALTVANGAIIQHERVLRGGMPVILELAPVDPRALMQGDYMALRFQVTDRAETLLAQTSELAADVRSHAGGWLVLAPDAAGVHRLRAIETAPRRPVSSSGEPDQAIWLAFRLRGDSVWIGTDAWFFAEGQAKRFEQARYGVFRVDPQGRARLADLLDARRASLTLSSPR